MAERHTSTEQVELITEPGEKARREAENGLRQTDLALEIIRSFVKDKERPFRLRQGMLLQLNAVALEGIHLLAGTYRNGPATIHESNHDPPPAYRTARAISYVVLSVKLDSLLPGTITIPDQIAADKTPYYDALEASDAPWKAKGDVNVSVIADARRDARVPACSGFPRGGPIVA